MSEYNITRNMLNVIRESKDCAKQLLSEDNTSNAVAITNSGKFASALTDQIRAFKAAVDSSVQFANVDESNPESSPLVYLKDTGNVILGGTLPSMNNLKFQYSLRDSDGVGCFVWSEDGLRLTNENLITLKKLYGYYLNWKDALEANEEFFDNLKEE